MSHLSRSKRSPLVFVLEAVDVEAEQSQGGLSGTSHG